MEAKTLLYLLAFSFALVLIFLVRTERISKTRAVALAGIFAIFPLFIYFLDRFFAPGLWERLVFHNSPEFWIARAAYTLAVLGLGFNAIWLALGGAIISGGIILFSANEIITVNNKIKQKEIEKQKVIENFEQEKNENSLVSGGTLDISFVEPGTYKIAVLTQETNYLIVEGAGWTIGFPDSLLLETKNDYGWDPPVIFYPDNNKNSSIKLTPGSRFTVPYRLGKYDKFCVSIERMGPEPYATTGNIFAIEEISVGEKKEFLLTPENDHVIIKGYGWTLNWPRNDSLLWQQPRQDGGFATVMMMHHGSNTKRMLKPNSRFKAPRLLKAGETYKITVTKISS